MGRPAPRTFLLTVYEPGSGVLEDLETGRRDHVVDGATLAARLAPWLDGGMSDRSAGEYPCVEFDGRLRRLDPELVDERAAAGEKLP